MSSRPLRRLLAASALSCLACAGAVGASGAASAASGSGTVEASVYLVQGVTGSTVAIKVDGHSVSTKAPAKAIIGPLSMTPGKHTVWVKGSTADQDVTSTISVDPGASMDVVVHHQVDPAAPPQITTYTNDLDPVAADTGRVVVAHVAAVGPANVLVRGKVLFANIANGEALSLTVPAGSYPIEVVPAATKGPPVLGPVNLPVKANALTRVYAIGVAKAGTMDAIVQVFSVGMRGTGATPSKIDTGNGGQAVPLIQAARDQQSGSAGALGAVGAVTVALLAGGGVVLARRRRAAP